MKGIGEAGIIGAPAAVVNAIHDALTDLVTADVGAPAPFTAIPVSPQSVVAALRSTR
jgi:CO/xanthine dehydrogenase Mo-binding subunit